MRHPDPVETPLPRPDTRPRSLSSADLAELAVHECLHPELIDDVRQSRKRRWPIVALFTTLVGGSILTLATCIYAQGQAAGETRARLEQVERRALEDRNEANQLRERVRESETAATQRHEEMLQTLHSIDSRLGRLEERLSIRSRR
jgi:hypothetical protein